MVQMFQESGKKKINPKKSNYNLNQFQEDVGTDV